MAGGCFYGYSLTQGVYGYSLYAVFTFVDSDNST